MSALWEEGKGEMLVAIALGRGMLNGTTVRLTASMMGAMGPVLFGAAAERGFFDQGYLLLAVLVVLSSTLRSGFPESDVRFVRTPISNRYSISLPTAR